MGEEVDLDMAILKIKYEFWVKLIHPGILPTQFSTSVTFQCPSFPHMDHIWSNPEDGNPQLICGHQYLTIVPYGLAFPGVSIQLIIPKSVMSTVVGGDVQLRAKLENCVIPLDMNSLHYLAMF